MLRRELAAREGLEVRCDVSKKQCAIISAIIGAVLLVLGLVFMISIFPDIIESRVDQEQWCKSAVRKSSYLERSFCG